MRVKPTEMRYFLLLCFSLEILVPFLIVYNKSMRVYIHKNMKLRTNKNEKERKKCVCALFSGWLCAAHLTSVWVFFLSLGYGFYIGNIFSTLFFLCSLENLPRAGFYDGLWVCMVGTCVENFLKNSWSLFEWKRCTNMYTIPFHTRVAYVNDFRSTHTNKISSSIRWFFSIGIFLLIIRSVTQSVALAHLRNICSRYIFKINCYYYLLYNVQFCYVVVCMCLTNPEQQRIQRVIERAVNVKSISKCHFIHYYYKVSLF